MKKVAARVSVTTKIDADRFGEAAETYAKHATKSKRAARETLVALGIYTKKGKLTKKYNS